MLVGVDMTQGASSKKGPGEKQMLQQKLVKSPPQFISPHLYSVIHYDSQRHG